MKLYCDCIYLRDALTTYQKLIPDIKRILISAIMKDNFSEDPPLSLITDASSR